MADEQKSGVRQAVKRHMGRRCFNWDYSSRCIYMITITLADRSRPILGRLVGAGEEWRVEPSGIGRVVEQCWREIPQQWPGVEIIESQLMPDHFHGLIFVKEPQRKKLGNIIGSFKSRSASRAGGGLAARGEAQNPACGEAQNLAVGVGSRGEAQGGAAGGLGSRGDAPRSCAPARAPGLWAPGYADLILFRAGQLEQMIAYLRDNPRRLGIKRANPALFKVARDLEVDFAARARAGIPPWHGPAKGRFMAIGNHFLLARPMICQIQCSRSFFAYRRRRLAGGWQICRDSAGKPIAERSTPEFEAKAAAALRAAAKGAVLLSPCISHGEREIARRAFEAGHRVITLRNKGFSPLYKPGGKLFETCAAGNLLMLSPIGWPHVPGEKPMTREQAQILNRVAQLISGEGAVEINYKGQALEGIDAAVAHAVERSISAKEETI